MFNHKNMKDKRFVCIVDTVYALLLFLLISPDEAINRTVFYFSDGIDHKIREKVNANYIKVNTNIICRFINILKLRIRSFFHPLNHSLIYCQDHLYISGALIGLKSYYLLEDGLSNYTRKNILNYKVSWLCEHVLGYIKHPYGINSNCKKIFLTRLPNKIPEILDKVVHVNMQNLWDMSSIRKKEYILSVFGITKEIVECLYGKSIIVFTQPLDEIEGISELRKIEIYSQILDLYDIKQLVIKPHPREITDYSLYFRNVCVCEKKIPFELLNILGVRFSRSVTIFSSAVFNFSYDISIDWIDTSNFPDIVSQIGYMDVTNFVTNTRRVNVVKNINEMLV